MILIKCDKCGCVTNEGEFSHTPPTISIDRGSNLIVGGGYNTKKWDLCEVCFANILRMIENCNGT